jgi:hypothetical protein
VAADTVRDSLRIVISAAGVPVIVHCCAPRPPLDLMRQAGAAGVAIDLDQVTDLDPLGEVLEAGVGLFAGVNAGGGRSGSGAAVSSNRSGRVGAAGRVAAGVVAEKPSVVVADRVRDLWRTIGFPADGLTAQVVVTPACGLAGFGQEAAVTAMRIAREASRRLADG